jgi:uncharacterized protein
MNKMRRTDRELSFDHALQILKRNQHGVLSLVLPDGTPYGVPINYGLYEQTIIMHAALVGLKIDAIEVDPHACFTVVHASTVEPETLSTHYASAMAFGMIRFATQPEEKRLWLTRLLAHYGIPVHAVTEALETDTPQASVLLLEITTLTGKGFADTL